MDNMHQLAKRMLVLEEKTPIVEHGGIRKSKVVATRSNILVPETPTTASSSGETTDYSTLQQQPMLHNRALDVFENKRDKK